MVVRSKSDLFRVAMVHPSMLAIAAIWPSRTLSPDYS
jgi:hypothetical protein